MCSKDGKSLPMNLGQLKTHGAGSMHLGNVMDEHSKVPPLFYIHYYSFPQGYMEGLPKAWNPEARASGVDG